jgi:hypothetical protein
MSRTMIAAPVVNVVPCTAEQGQELIDAGQYKQTIREFTCVIDLDPTAVEGYRGRIEAELRARLYDAVRHAPPVLFLHAANDYSTASGEGLAAKLGTPGGLTD